MGVVYSKDFEMLLENVLRPCNMLIFTSKKEDVEKLYSEFLRNKRVLDNRLEEFRADFLDKLDSFG